MQRSRQRMDEVVKKVEGLWERKKARLSPLMPLSTRHFVKTCLAGGMSSRGSGRPHRLEFSTLSNRLLQLRRNTKRRRSVSLTLADLARSRAARARRRTGHGRSGARSQSSFRKDDTGVPYLLPCGCPPSILTQQPSVDTGKMRHYHPWCDGTDVEIAFTWKNAVPTSRRSTGRRSSSGQGAMMHSPSSDDDNGDSDDSANDDGSFPSLPDEDVDSEAEDAMAMMSDGAESAVSGATPTGTPNSFASGFETDGSGGDNSDLEGGDSCSDLEDDEHFLFEREKEEEAEAQERRLTVNAARGGEESKQWLRAQLMNMKASFNLGAGQGNKYCECGCGCLEGNCALSTPTGWFGLEKTQAGAHSSSHAAALGMPLGSMSSRLSYGGSSRRQRFDSRASTGSTGIFATEVAELLRETTTAAAAAPAAAAAAMEEEEAEAEKKAAGGEA